MNGITNSMKGSVVLKNGRYQKGQKIIYKGQEASILEIKPVFTIRIKGKRHVICGNILNDVSPCRG